MEPSSRKQPSAAAPTDPSSLDTRGRQTQEIFHAEGLVNQLTTQAHNFLILFQRSGVTENLDKSIQCQNQAVHLTPDEHVTKLSHMNDLGGLYLRRFQRLGELTDLDKAIDCHDIVVAATPDGDMGKPSRLNNLSVGYRLRFDHAGKLEDMDNAIQCLHEAIETTDDDHPRKPGWLNNLGNVHHSRFKRLGEINDIQKAIECHTLAVAVTPDNQRTKPTRQNNLANAHQSRFELLGELEDLENAIQYHSQAVQCIEDGHEDKPLWLSNLGHSYELRFMSQGDTADLEHSISYLSEAVSRTPQDHPDMPRRLSNLGSCWIKRYERGGEPDDLDKGFQYLTSAVEHIPEGHEAMPDVFSNLAVAHQRRFEHLGNPEELDKATHWSNLAATVIPENHKERPAILANLGNTYSFRFGCSGDPEDINQAIRYLSQAASLAPDNHTSKPAWLSNLGSYHADRFGRLGELTDLNHAMEYTDRAISLLPDGHAERPRMLANLGDSYVTRYERLGELDDIDRAIDNYSQAARSTQDGHGHRARILSDLGSSHLSRFDRLREPLDINIAVEYQCQAVALTPDGHAEMPKRLNNLAITYYRRFSQLGDIADNDKSIGYLNQAVELTDDGHGDKPIWLGNLGGSYFQRFEHLGEMSDLQKVIDYTNRAVELSPIDHADNLTRLKNLGVAYWSRFQRLRVAVDIDKALDCMNRAAELTPDDHAQKPDTLTYLGMICIERSNYLGDHQIFSVAIEHFRRAAQSDNGPPHARFRAARNWASLSDEKSSKLLAFQRAMELLPHLIWLGTTIDQRYSFITMMGDVTTEAAAFAISYGASGQALEWLEQGRSIVWNQILQLRTPFEELVDIDPYLAQRLEEVGRELERAGSRSITMPSLPNYKSDLEQEAQNHHRLAVEWDRLLKQARQLPEFGDFLRPHTTATLTRVAKDGPVVVINIHQSRCDALVIQRNCEDIAHIPLQRFSAKKAMEIRSQIAPLVGRQGSDSGTRYLILNPHKRPRSYSFDVMLAALWTDVAKPILEFLGFTRPLPVEELPHITWCTTGALSFLPVHAAGCYDGSHPSIFDLVISSYTPTLSALLAIPPQTHNHQSGILAIGQESTEGMTRLPCTRQELNVIREHAQNTPYSQLKDEKATVNTVLSAMDNYSWIHLACHATQQAEDPAKSAFHLHDGNLMLSAITQRSFQNKGLAFLSACQTAAGSKELPDEALHLAAGMLMAGYPSVIATMWAIQDEDAPEVARGVYEELLKDGKMDCTKASRALHRAMGHLRAKIGERSYERWVPFVHIGV